MIIKTEGLSKLFRTEDVETTALDEVDLPGLLRVGLRRRPARLPPEHHRKGLKQAAHAQSLQGAAVAHGTTTCNKY